MKNTLETRLGIFFATALVVSVIILEMIGAADFLKPGYLVQASFGNVQELKEGDQVKTAGVQIGRVEKIELANNRALVTMKLRAKHEIKTDSQAVIKFTGLMGQNFVSIEGGTPAALKATAGFTLNTREQPDLGAIMEKLQAAASGIEGLKESFKPESFSSLLGPILDTVKSSSNSIIATLNNARTISDQIAQGKGTVGKLVMNESLYDAAYGAVTNLQVASADLRSVMQDAGGMVGKAGALLDQVNAGQGTLGKLAKDEALYRETATAMTNLREILEKINRGEGSAGKVVNDDTLIKNAKVSLQKLDKAMDSLEDQGPLSVLGLVIGTLF